MLGEVPPARLLWVCFRGISSSLHPSGEQQNHGEYTGMRELLEEKGHDDLQIQIQRQFKEGGTKEASQK